MCVFAVRSGWRLVPGPFASGPLPAKITAPRVQREKLREREKKWWKKLKGSVERGESATGLYEQSLSPKITSTVDHFTIKEKKPGWANVMALGSEGRWGGDWVEGSH